MISPPFSTSPPQSSQHLRCVSDIGQRGNLVSIRAHGLACPFIGDADVEKRRARPLKKPLSMLILASNSPTRKTLLENAGLRFQAVPADIDERALETAVRSAGGGKPDIALALAVAKAESVSKSRPGAVVIGADQVLECGDLDIHKPSNRTDAARQLRQLAGRTHFLHCGVALARNGQSLWRTIDSAELRLKAFDDAALEIVLDLEGEAIFASVAGYRLEGPSVRLFDSVRGDYFTILGLPLLALLDALRHLAPETLAGETPT